MITRFATRRTLDQRASVSSCTCVNLKNALNFLEGQIDIIGAEFMGQS